MVIEACRDAQLIVHCYTPITRRVIENAPNLRGIVKYGVGIDAIDIQAAKDHKVAVANIPEYGEETVAEGAFSLMLSLARKVKPMQQVMVAKEAWAWPTEEWLGTDLANKSLCMLGNGRIGKCFARMAKGFRMRMFCYDPYVSAEEMAIQQITKVHSLDELCTIADFLSIHTVLNSETRGIIGKRELALLKPSASLINVSRGPIVDEKALAHAVLSGNIAGIGIDVFGEEPLSHDPSHVFAPLLTLPNCIFTPHLAFWTTEARQRLMDETIERCQEILHDKPLTVLSKDPRLQQQTGSVTYGGWSVASGRYVVA